MDLNSVSLQEGQWVDKAYWDAQERAREREAGTYLDYGYTRPAVVSGGPVESGMATEGNSARPGMIQQPAPESKEEEESDDSDKEKKSGEKPPIASNYWKDFGSSDTQQPEVVTSSGRNSSRNVSDASIPVDNSKSVPAVGQKAGNQVSSIEAQWRPKTR